MYANKNFDKLINFLFITFVLVLLLKGLVRKILPVFGELVYLTSDLILLQIILLFFIKYKNLQRQHIPAYICYITLIFIVTLATVKSLFLKNEMLIVVLGIREYLLPPIVFFVGYRYFTNSENLAIFLSTVRAFGFISAIIGILVILFNFNSPVFTPVAGHLEAHNSDFGDFGYVASIFDSPEKYTYFLLFVFCFTFPLYRRSNLKLLLYCCIILLGIAVSGRRVGIVLAILNLFIFFTFVEKNPKFYLFLAFMSPILLWIFSVLTPTLFQVLSTTTLSDISYYFGEWLIQDVRTIFDIGVDFISSNFGQGSPGASAFHENTEFWGVESLISRISFYVGFLGLVVFTLLLTVILGSLASKCFKNPNPLIFSSLIFCFSTVLWNIKSGNILVWPEFFFISLAIGYTLSVRKYKLPMTNAKETY